MPIFEDQYAPISDGHLPVQLPAVEQAGDDPSGHYASLPQPVAVFNGLDGIIYTYSTITSPLGVKSMFSGMVTYLPANTSYAPVLSDFTVNSEITTTTQGGVLLELFPIVGQALKTLPDSPDGGSPLDGVFIPAYILIEGVDAATFRSDMQALMPDVVDAILDLSWMETEGNAPGTREEKENKFLDRLMLGEKQLAVGGGDDIGMTTLNADSHPEFVLKMYSSEVETGSVSYVFYASRVDPLLFIQRFPLFIDPTDTANNYFSKWHNHPLITAIADFSANVMRAYIKFEVWNPGSPTGALPEYAPVDPGLTVKLMDYDTFLNSDDELAIATTNDNGVAFFQIDIPEDGWLNGSPPDLYFKILAPIASMASDLPPLPAEWSTKANSGTNYWLSTSGEKGYYENFSGTQLGSPANPLVFRIGVDFHIKFELLNPYQGGPLGRWENFPSGINVDIYATDLWPDYEYGGDTNPDLGELIYSERTSDDVIHGILFTINPNDNFLICAHYNIADPSINLLETRVHLKSPNDSEISRWYTSFPDTKIRNSGVRYDDFKNLQKNSIGSSSSPIVFQAADSNNTQRFAGFYILKIAKEISTFLHYFTVGSYPGVELTYKLWHLNPDATPTAWPIGNIWLTENPSSWKRRTIVHETFHQVMWNEANFDSGVIANQFIYDIILSGAYHRVDLFSTPWRALTEGWCIGFDSIFESRSSLLEGLYRLKRDFTEPHSATNTVWLNPSSSSELAVGLGSEGATANYIFNVFWKRVVNSSLGGILGVNVIVESNDGNILNSNSWMTASNQLALSDKFMRYFWEPLRAMEQYIGIPPEFPASFDFYTETLDSAQSSEIHMLHGEIAKWNCYEVEPVLHSLSETSGPAGGGTTIILMGANFIMPVPPYLAEDATSYADIIVKMAGVTHSNITVLSHEQIRFTVPSGSSGATVSVTVEIIIRGFVLSSNSLPFT
ncbi:MAG: IPT/TIG domain-containing protein [Lewinella sp.]|uniref:IPT/TIG domain-containing protein n=1 Tax=Lewinella sp. TaxID=2004506 RepID=UPI003D6BEEA5